MRFLWKSHRFSKKNRTFAPKCQIHMNTEQVLGDTEQEKIYGITNKHRRTAEGEDYGMITSLRRCPYTWLLLMRRLILSLLDKQKGKQGKVIKIA